MTLLPLSIEELVNAGRTLTLDGAIAAGFLPRVHAGDFKATDITKDKKGYFVIVKYPVHQSSMSC